MKMRESYVDSEGHKIAYKAFNEEISNQDNQPVFVFIHGVFTSLNFWEYIVENSFLKDKCWYSLGLPAHYPSEATKNFSEEVVDDKWFYDIMSQALKKLLGDRKAIIVGHSTGGFVSLVLAMNKCPNVLGVISIGGFHKGKWGGIEGLLLKIASLGLWAKALFVPNKIFTRFRIVQRVIFYSIVKNKIKCIQNPTSGKTLTNFFHDLSRNDFNAWFYLYHGISKIDILKKLKEIEIPCYIFYGTHDHVVSVRQSLSIISKISNAKTVLFNSSGHMPFIEEPEDFYLAFEKAVKDILENCENESL